MKEEEGEERLGDEREKCRVRTVFFLQTDLYTLKPDAARLQISEVRCYEGNRAEVWGHVSTPNKQPVFVCTLCEKQTGE